MKTKMEMDTTTTRTFVRVIDDGENRAVVTVTRGSDSVTIQYWAPSSGGYVREIDDTHPGTLGHQVSDEGLHHGGSMLEWSGRGSLSNLIRRKIRARVGREHMLERLQRQIDGW